MKIEEKAVHFLIALSDVYSDDEHRELEALPGLCVSDDMTEDITAMLVAMHHFCGQVSNIDGDLIDFTHTLNKLAVQYIVDGRADDGF